MATANGGESTVRSRTRRAILGAAVEVLGTNPGASLGEVAAAAGVGRTTLHRYFPERSDLLQAIGTEALDQVQAASDRARIDEGTAIEAFERLARELFDLGDLLMIAFNVSGVTDGAAWVDETDADRAFYALVERGHADGTIDPGVPSGWAQSVLWALLYSAWEYRRDACVTRHEALALALKILLRSVRPSP